MNVFASIALLFYHIFFPIPNITNDINKSILLNKTINDSLFVIKKSPNDTRNYLYLKLDNGIQTVLINDPDAPSTAASVLVKAGSNANPPDKFAGLAHYVEHVLFLGTAKYRNREVYVSWDAETTYSNTVYFCDNFDNLYVDDFIDKLAHMFIDPLFDPKFLDKERHSVDSEFNQAASDDNQRSFEVLKQVMNPNHSFNRFDTGNLKTLPSVTNGTLRQSVIEFFNQYYGPQNLVVAILSSRPLSALKKAVMTSFGKVPKTRKSMKPPNMDNVPLFVNDNLPIFVTAQSVSELKLLAINFQIPGHRSIYKTKSLQYIDALILNTNVHGLNDYYYQQGYIDSDIVSGYDAISNSQTLYQISISLTSEGFDKIDQVINTFFNYLKLIDQKGVEKWRYAELQEIANLQWTYLPKSDAISTTKLIVQNIQQYYNVSDALYADYNYDHFSEKSIRNILTAMKPEKAIYMLMYKSFVGDKLETQYNISYSVSEVTVDRLENWKKIGNLPMRLPAKNSYIIVANTTKLSINNNLVVNVPLLVINSSNARVWCMNPDPFKSPEFNMTYTLQSADTISSIENVLMATLLDDLISEIVSMQFSPALTAGNTITVSAGNGWISVVIGTYCMSVLQKLSIDIDELLTNLTITEKLFNRYKTSLKETLQANVYAKPSDQSKEILAGLLMTSGYSTDAKLDVIDNITFDSINDYIISQMSNYTLFEAFLMIPTDCHKIKPDILPIMNGVNLVPDTDVKFFNDSQTSSADIIDLLPNGAFVYTIDTEHADSSIVCYYQPSEVTLETKLITLQLEYLFNNLFYEQLRTQQQLGYTVSLESYYSDDSDKTSVQGLIFVIESSPNTFTPSQLYHRIQTFIASMTSILNNMTVLEFLNQKIAVKQSLLQKPTNRDQLYTSIYAEIDSQRYQFNRNQKLANAFKTVFPLIGGMKSYVNDMQMFESSTNGTWIIIRTPETQPSVLDNFEQIDDVMTFKDDVALLNNIYDIIDDYF